MSNGWKAARVDMSDMPSLANIWDKAEKMRSGDIIKQILSGSGRTLIGSAGANNPWGF